MSGTKIKRLHILKEAIASHKKQRKKIVFTNGCFDILHYGHVSYLKKSKSEGDILVVGINSDASVKKIKGNSRPVVPEQDRARVLAGLQAVDYVVIFDEDTPINIIQALKPDVLVKGADWKVAQIVGADFVKSYGGKIKTIRFERGRSSSGIIKKIAKIYGKKSC